jgi:polar amino acid transport system substrate-binding protein
MKKLLAIIMALALVFSFAGCKEESKSDLEHIKDKGTLVVGITDFAPMDYRDNNGEWIGFDAELAKAFAESLGVKVQFTEIDWDNKAMELDGKTIDCVWNGMTLTEEVKAAMSTSKPYCNNAQIVIVKKDVADKYKTAADCKNLKFAVEAGSAGEKVAKENGFTYTPVKDQATALLEIKSGTSEAAIIDSLMAAAMVGEGTAYADLAYTVKLNSEEYGVGFRKGSDLTEKLNDFLKKCYDDGTITELAEKYGIQAAIIEQ